MSLALLRVKSMKIAWAFYDIQGVKNTGSLIVSYGLHLIDLTWDGHKMIGYNLTFS